MSGSLARALAMHSRCCWPAERSRAESPSRSLTSVLEVGERQCPIDDLIEACGAAELLPF